MREGREGGRKQGRKEGGRKGLLARTETDINSNGSDDDDDSGECLLITF